MILAHARPSGRGSNTNEETPMTTETPQEPSVDSTDESTDVEETDEEMPAPASEDVPDDEPGVDSCGDET
jgi:hypothetical protein